jgi:hypothetical protein
MSARTSAGIACLFLALAAPASAQVTSAPLGQLDPWSVGWLGRNDGQLASSIWANTSSEALAPVYAELKPGQLSPAARAALRRVALSAAKSPADGGADLIPERLRLIEQLGETDRSIDLRKRYSDTPWGKRADRLASDFDLLHDRVQPGCARVTGKRADDQTWMPLRAFCFALAGDFDAASLAAEHIATDETNSGVWLLAAISTMEAPGKTRPEGRYATPFEAAVSMAAKLSAPASALANAPPDVAAAIVQHPSATLEQKRAALRPALDGGRLKPADVLAVVNAKDETPTVKAAGGRAAAPKTDFLALALTAAANAEAKPDARATAYAAALKSAETPSDFRLAAYALLDPIKALPKTDATASHAETFARAALLAGDIKAAQDWRKTIDEKADPWAAARIDLLLSYATTSGDKTGAILDRLIASVPPAPPTQAKAATPATRQLDLRRIENTRALFLYSGTGRELSPAQRALLASQKSAGRGVSDAALTRITAAADQDADGEAALASIALLGSDVSALSFAGLADILTQMRRVGLEADANALALEALQVWKAL